MWLCDLARLSPFLSTVEKHSGKTERASFPLFHTPYKGVEKWKKAPPINNYGKKVVVHLELPP
jgi:hypothetical protein